MARAGCRVDRTLSCPGRVYRACAKLVAAHRAGRLKFFGVHARLDDIKAFNAYLAPLRKIEQMVYAKGSFGGPRAVLAYALWAEATEANQKYGAMVKFPTGYPIQSPYVRSPAGRLRS